VASFVTEALVLRVFDFGESDVVVHLLTPETGRLVAIAQGAKRSRRRFSGTLDFFNQLRVQADRRPSRAMARLEHATLVHSFQELRLSPPRFALGCYLLELLGRLAPEGGARADMQRLFAFATAALSTIARRQPDSRLRTLLELRALDTLGLRPELRVCVRCGGELGPAGAVAFHVAEGGPVCGACSPPLDGLLHVHLGTLRALDQGLRLPEGRLDRLALQEGALREARHLLGRFTRFHLGIELRSERFLEETLSPAEVRAGRGDSTFDARSGPRSDLRAE
jgi:DNA repair protein RecO (recombination protein O)